MAVMYNLKRPIDTIYSVILPILSEKRHLEIPLLQLLPLLLEKEEDSEKCEIIFLTN